MMVLLGGETFKCVSHWAEDRKTGNIRVLVPPVGEDRKKMGNFSLSLPSHQRRKTGNVLDDTPHLGDRRVKPGNVPKAYGCNVSRRFSFFAFTWREERKNGKSFTQRVKPNNLPKPNGCNGFERFSSSFSWEKDTGKTGLRSPGRRIQEKREIFLREG